MADYTTFKVLLDDPADRPGLGFAGYSSALAEIIVHSRAEFAVGIFGSWGSGKTTLMREIERRLAVQPEVVTVWFTAWRYEKEIHLIVPLLDVLREALDQRAATFAGEQSPARRAAAAVARATRAFLAGVTVSAGLPGAEARWEPDKTITALKVGNDQGDESLSFYHAGFAMLRDAILEFSAGGTRRVVVFVDDLDRCLPSAALEILESMKLFFDVEGCVFVVGLDQTIAERAVAHKYSSLETPAGQGVISGNDYVKKIFQVPFALPRISTNMLEEYLSTVAVNAELSGGQLADFNQNVRKHLAYLSGEDTVNPREVKRLINTYTLQLKMLGGRLGDRLDSNIVLALQCMHFRPDWRGLYDHLAADPQLFQSTVRSALGEAETPDAIWLSSVKTPLPPQFVRYLESHGRPLLDTPDLESYVSVAEATQSTDPSILEAQTMISKLRRGTDRLAAGNQTLTEAKKELPSEVHRLSEICARRASSSPQLARAVGQLGTLAEELTAADPTAEGEAEFVEEWTAKTTQLLNTLDGQLREMRRQTSVGANQA